MCSVYANTNVLVEAIGCLCVPARVLNQAIIIIFQTAVSFLHGSLDHGGNVDEYGAKDRMKSSPWD